MSSTELPPLYDLDAWNKLTIIAAACTFLLIVGILVFCSISPLCCLYHFCVCKEKDEKDQKNQGYGSTGGGHKAVMPPLYGNYKHYDHHHYHQQPLHSFRDTDTSDWSDYSSHDIVEMKQDRLQKDAIFKPIRSDATSPTPSLSFMFENCLLEFGVAFDQVEGKVSVRVQKLSNFSSSDPEGAMTPYVKVRLYRTPRSFFKFRGKASKDSETNNPDMEFQTKMLRRSAEPVFNEIFVIPVDANEIQHYTLKLLVFDFDRYQRHVAVGEVVVAMSKIEWTKEEIEFKENLQPPSEENLGEVQIGLMFLPTAEKLSLSVLKAQSLKIMDQKSGTTNCCMKVNLMFDGRPIKKTKTSVTYADLSPVFNETMTFDVPQHQLDKVYFSISVLHVNKSEEKVSRSLIGRLYIGMNFDLDARMQWQEMVGNPRQQVVSWHKLQI